VNERAPHATADGALPEVFFLAVPGGQRLCLFHPPNPGPVAPRGRVLYLHPFAEELNTSRRVVAQQARALAAAGFAVLQIDLMGCGDSSGEMAHARWTDWLQDAHAALRWLDQRLLPATRAEAPLWLWGLRSGALLAAALARQLGGTPVGPPHLLLWQPVASGQQMLQQFLRLHAAAQWLQPGAPVSTEGPAQALARGDAVDIAGYRLTPALAGDLREARLLPVENSAHKDKPRRLVWLGCEPAPEPRFTPAALQQQAAWRAAGWSVRAEAVQGPAFWQGAGMHEAPALLQATTAALCATG
jgi:uncharacterized protein